MTMWANGINIASPPPLGLYWLPDPRVAGKRRNGNRIESLVSGMGRWKEGDRTQLDAVNNSWSPIVKDGILPRLPSDITLDEPEFIAIRGMEGSVLAVARRRNASSPNDRLADTVAAMHYNGTNSVTQYPLINVLASWLFAVGYWAYHQPNQTLAIDRCLALLDDPNAAATIVELAAEERFQPRA